MKDISKDIISKIKKKKICPKPKWQFLMKNYVFWGVFGFSILVGGISVSVMFFQIMTNEWDIARRMADSLLHFILISLPYFWFVLMVGFSFLAHHYIRKTKKGYKYSVLTINIVSISSSIVLGAILFFTGMSFHIHKVMHGRVPMYDRMMNMHHEILMDEDKGIVIGRIKELGINEMNVIDLRKRIWEVDTSNSVKKFLDKPKEGDDIIVIGEIEGNQITAEIIRSGDRRKMRDTPLFERFRNTLGEGRREMIQKSRDR